MEITRLIERCKQGDKDALGELYMAYAPQMKGVCRRYFSNEQVVNDVVHDAFVIIFTSLNRLREPRMAEQWMMSIVRNVASKHKIHLEQNPMVSLEEVAESDLCVDERAEQYVKGFSLDEVMQLIDRLPDGYGNVFRLSVFDGMSHKEIATLMHIEPHTSSSQLTRAKKLLRMMMSQYWAMILLLLVPVGWYLFRKKETSEEKKTEIAQQKESREVETPENNGKEPLRIRMAKHRYVQTIKTIEPSLVAYAIDTLAAVDSISKVVAEREQEHEQADSTHEEKDGKPTQELHLNDMNSLYADMLERNGKQERKWSMDIAYSGQFDSHHAYNQPYVYRPSYDRSIQSSPSPLPTPHVPETIDNWNDYVVYLTNHPETMSEQTRKVVMRIAMNNAEMPGDGKFMRTAHHYMPVTWSLALKYEWNHRWGMETGLMCNRLSSTFEMGTEGNTINERQTIHYLGIPLKGVYHLYRTPSWSLYGSLGLTMEWPVHSPLHTDYYIHGKLEASENNTIHAPWQWSSSIGLGLQYQLTPTIGFFVEPSMNYYIPMGNKIETYRTEHPFVFILPLGIKFSW